MAMLKPTIKFKTYRQAAAVGGKIYGVPNLGDPVVANVTMQEVIDYAKLHNYSADTLSALLSQVIAGVGDLVARDGRPRMLSDLLKFEPVIKGTFDNMEQTVTNQKIVVRPRMLKEIKLNLNAGDYAWQNVNDKDSPRLISAAPVSDAYPIADLGAFLASISLPYFGWSLAGDRLAPNGNNDYISDKIRFGVIVRRLAEGVTTDYHYEVTDKSPLEITGTFGVFSHTVSDDATDNVFVLSATTPEFSLAWTYDEATREAVAAPDFVPAHGDTLIFQFQRITSTGDKFLVEKSYTL